MKRTLSLILVVIMMLTFAGCGSPDAERGTDENKLKIGLLLTGDISDNGWNHSAYQGLQEAAEALGAEFSYVVNVEASDYMSLARSYGAEGYDYVFGHGYQFVDTFKTVAPDFPETRWVINSSEEVQDPNLVSIYIDTFGQGVLQAVFAAKYSKTKKIAFIGAEEIPPTLSSLEGARIGAAYADPDVEMYEAFIGNATDVARAKELTLAFMDQGVDVFVTFASGAASGVYEALESRPELECVAIGSAQDRYPESPEHIATSVFADYAVADPLVLKGWEDGSLPFEIKQYYYGVKEGVVGYVDLQGKFVDEVPADVWDYCKRFEAAVKDGTIVLDGVTDASQIPQI